MASDSGGRRLGRYHLGEPLGGGPTGVVYRAKVFGVAGFERKFAIKRFHDELVHSPSMAARVAGAARAYGSLEHPNIARLHEFGVAGGETFTATELVEGIDLRRLIASLRGGLKPGSAAKTLVMAARAVSFGHGRGHSHLGICPTNILLTPEGLAKVSDFGILPPRLPKRPAQDSTLDERIPYLAPEQLAGEPTSAATDVYQLGVIGYILFVGESPFSAPSAFEVAQMIMSANPPEPVLSRPVVKVLRRCLARSPFERYPDAGALADAIEDAADAAALPGGTAELAELVQSEMKRLEGLPPEARNLPRPAPPASQLTSVGPAPSPKRVVRGAGRLSTSDFKKTMMGVAPKAAAPPPPSEPSKNPFAERSPDSQADTRIAPKPFDDQSTMSESDEDELALGPAGGPGATGEHPAIDAIPEEIELGKSGKIPAFDAEDTVQAPPGSVERALAADSGPIESITIEAEEPDDDAQTELFPAPISSVSPTPAPPPTPAAPPAPVGSLPLPAGDPTEPPGQPMLAPPGPAAPPLPTTSPTPAAVTQAEVAPSQAKKKGGGLMIAAVVAALAGGGGFAAFTFLSGGDDAGTNQAPAGESDPPSQATTKSGNGDGQTVAAAKAADAAVPDAPVPDAAPTTLVINSKPEGAKIYLDGSEIGKTPHTMDATADKHRLALILAGYRLHVADVEGRGTIDVALEEVTPSGGRAGIKVRCKKKNRYYVFVDGKDAGQLCPTERIGVSKGPHVVEIYDPVTDSRSEFKANVQKTSRSHRVYVD